MMRKYYVSARSAPIRAFVAEARLAQMLQRLPMGRPALVQKQSVFVTRLDDETIVLAVALARSIVS